MATFQSRYAHGNPTAWRSMADSPRATNSLSKAITVFATEAEARAFLAEDRATTSNISTEVRCIDFIPNSITDRWTPF